VEAFIEEKLPFLRRCGTAVICNIFGETAAQYGAVAARLAAAGGVDALEVNVSCPNVKRGGVAFGTDPAAAAAVTRQVKAASELPVIVKLTPNVTDITVIARAVADAGADALSRINTRTGMAVDVETRRPLLASVTGGLSGPAIKPVALRMVWQVCQCVPLPVIGVGGITTAADALEFLIAGARAVEVGTANFFNPRATVEIIAGITAYLERHGLHDVNELIGSLRQA